MHRVGWTSECPSKISHIYVLPGGRGELLCSNTSNFRRKALDIVKDFIKFFLPVISSSFRYLSALLSQIAVLTATYQQLNAVNVGNTGSLDMTTNALAFRHPVQSRRRSQNIADCAMCIVIENKYA